MDANGIIQTPAAPRQRRGRLLTVVSVLLLTGAVTGTFFLYKAERTATAPIRTSDKFIKEMLNKNIDVAYAMTSDTFQAATSREEFGQVAETASAALDKQSLQVQAGEIEENEVSRKALLTYSIKAEDQEYEMKVTVIQRLDDETKRWLIHSVSNSEKNS